MKLTPLTRYPSARYPQAGAARARADLIRALPQRWRAQPKVVAVLAACLALSGCGHGPASQRLRDTVDRAAIALHLKQSPVRLMGMAVRVRVPLPNSTPQPPPPPPPSHAHPSSRGHTP